MRWVAGSPRRERQTAMPEPVSRDPRDPMARLASGDLAPAERRRLVRRWIAAAATAVDPAAGRFSRFREASKVAAPEAAYADVLASASAHFGEAEREGRGREGEARALVAELLAMPEGRQQTLVANHPRHWTWELCQALCDALPPIRRAQPLRAVQVARLAVAVAERVAEHAAEPAGGGRLVEDLRAQTRAELANALRVAGDLREADAVLYEAGEAAARGTGDPVLLGRLASFEVSLRNDQARFLEALAAGRRALGQFRRAGDRHLEGCVLVNLASTHGFLGELPEALAVLELACERIDRQRLPLLSYFAHHNRAWLLTDAERYAEAAELLPLCSALLDPCGVGPLDRLRLRRLTGRVAAGLGRYDEAERELRAARAELLSRQLAYDAALVSLELALVYTEQGRHAEVRVLADEMVPIFADREVHREALAALQLFCEAARAEAAQSALLREILAFLGRARGNPSLRFRGPR